MNIKGIDISSWQQGIDFSVVKRAGVKVVYIKATQGINYVDKTFKSFYESAKVNGLDIGFYHFLLPTISGQEQAKYMYSQIKDLEYQCKIAIDIEVTDGATNSNVNKCVLDFANEIKLLTGDEPIIYSYLNFANTILDKSVSNLEFWQAQYGVNSPTPTTLFRNNLVGWQYSNEGHFPQTTDLDIFSDQIYRNSKGSLGESKTTVVTPTPSKPIAPVSSNIKENFNIGESVKIKDSALSYATGQEIPSWVKSDIYTIGEISNNKVLLEPINSWFYINDIVSSQNKVKNFVVGEHVKVKQNALSYTTGQEIPNWVRGNVYTISEISGDKILLEPINSWILKSNLEIV